MPYTPMNARKNYDGFGRTQIDDDVPDTEIADIKDPMALGNSVGNSDQNNRRDVAKVETMLGQADNCLKVDAEINPNARRSRN